MFKPEIVIDIEQIPAWLLAIMILTALVILVFIAINRWSTWQSSIRVNILAEAAKDSLTTVSQLVEKCTINDAEQNAKIQQLSNNLTLVTENVASQYSELKEMLLPIIKETKTFNSLAKVMDSAKRNFILNSKEDDGEICNMLQAAESALLSFYDKMTSGENLYLLSPKEVDTMYADCSHAPKSYYKKLEVTFVEMFLPEVQIIEITFTTAIKTMISSSINGRDKAFYDLCATYFQNIVYLLSSKRSEWRGKYQN